MTCCANFAIASRKQARSTGHFRAAVTALTNAVSITEGA